MCSRRCSRAAPGLDGHPSYHGGPFSTHIATSPVGSRTREAMKVAVVGLAVSVRVTIACVAVISRGLRSTLLRCRSDLRSETFAARPL